MVKQTTERSRPLPALKQAFMRASVGPRDKRCSTQTLPYRRCFIGASMSISKTKTQSRQKYAFFVWKILWGAPKGGGNAPLIEILLGPQRGPCSVRSGLSFYGSARSMKQWLCIP